ncbi:MAG TPA: PmoA family protein, partial [Flavitalea sp.]|nr:PmoA family protein [Flavitalea sp.]
MAQKKKGFDILEQPRQKQVSVFWKGKLVTAYCYYDSIRKPFLFPVNTTTGITVTRGYPLIPAAGERTDHPHHTGVWMNYESVNGLDFWNNSTAIPVANRNHYGTIRHKELKTYRTGNKEASLNVTAEWITPEGEVLLDEITTYKFQVKDNDFYIDRITTLQARSIEVVFADVKDGFFAIRVARELEMPTQQSDVFIDAQGNKTSVPKINNEGVTGMYFTSEGKTGDSAWGTKG